MADSKFKPKETLDSDLILCGICSEVINNPKSLPCLHTFCFRCLYSWSKSSAKKNPGKYANTIACPNCRDESPLPKGGVKELRTNHFVGKLKERNDIQQKLKDKVSTIPCTSCDNSGSKRAVAHCLECNDFLCKICVGVHKSVRVLKHHQVHTLEEFSSENLASHNVPEQEICPKHTSEVLRYYCETCDEPLCRDCTVLDHPPPRHKHIDLKGAADGRRHKLHELLKRVEIIPEAIDAVTIADGKTLNELEFHVNKSIGLYKTTSEQAATEFLQKMENMNTEFVRDIEQLEAKRRNYIELHIHTLQFQKSRLCNALQLTRQIMQNGSNHDVTTMYPSLCSTLQQLSKLNPRAVTKAMGTINFIPSQNLATGLRSLGSLNTYKQWSLRNTIPLEQKCINNIVLTTNDEIVVTSDKIVDNVRILYENGTFARQIKTNISDSGRRSNDRPNSISRPWAVAIAPNGNFFITDTADNTNYVKIFNSNGKFERKFIVENPNTPNAKPACKVNYSRLYSLAIDTVGRVYVGSSNKYISIHNQNGSRVSSFNTNICPNFITIAQGDLIIISDSSRAVQVYDINGSQLHTFATPPEGRFYPTGLCVVRDEVYVASGHGQASAVYSYSINGECNGILTKEVLMPRGIVSKGDGKELLVCDNNAIKVFVPKQ